MKATRLRSAFVVGLTIAAWLPAPPAGAQAPSVAFIEPSTRVRSVEIQQVAAPVLCPDGLLGRAIIVQNFEELAGAVVIFTMVGTPSGVVQFSFSLEGPFADTLEVPIQLDGSGSGTSELVVVKGVGPGLTAIEACSPDLGCVPTPFPVTVLGIAGLEFAALDSVIDSNPNPGGGLRLYPDRQSPADSVNRRVVQVRAFTIPQEPGLSVTFRSFDVDDPSSDSRPVDPNGLLGDDNRGEPGPGSLADLVADTDASGIATTVLTVTMQPGDNFKVAAACDPDYLDGVIVNGVDLQDADANILPTVHARASDMLTVWRRVHIEVDSMGIVTGNQVSGVVTDVDPDPASFTTDVRLDQLLDAKRFERGQIEIAGSGRFDVVTNDKSTVTLPVMLTEGTGQSFILWDDDDFNGDDTDPRQLDGDDGENVTAPSTALLNDSRDNGICDYSFLNVFGAAYVCPVFDIGDDNDFVPFVLNLPRRTASAIIALYDFDNAATERDPTFWTVYLLGGYQYITAADFDPDDTETTAFYEKQNVVGIADGKQGAVVFKETVTDINRHFDPVPIGCHEAATVAHEIGHLFGGDHPDGGVMSNSCETTPILAERTIATIRDLSHP